MSDGALCRWAAIGWLSSAVLWAVPTGARDATGYFDQPIPAACHAFELADSLGYTQGFGMIAPGRALPRVVGVGLGVTVNADYRLGPTLALGVEAQYQEFAFTPQQNKVARGLTTNAGLTYHVRPSVRADPWIRVGSGYRLLWELEPSDQPGVTVLRHGLQLLTVKVGYDVRLSEELAVAPFAGADLNLFLWENPSNANGFAMSPAQWGAFLVAGIQGRYDLLSEHNGRAKLLTGAR